YGEALRHHLINLSSTEDENHKLFEVHLRVSRHCHHPPPVKWSTLSYGFARKEDRNAEEELQTGRDCRQAAPGWCADLAGSGRGRGNLFDRGQRGDLLSVAARVWRDEERSDQADKGIGDGDPPASPRGVGPDTGQAVPAKRELVPRTPIDGSRLCGSPLGACEATWPWAP